MIYDRRLLGLQIDDRNASFAMCADQEGVIQAEGKASEHGTFEVDSDLELAIVLVGVALYDGLTLRHGHHEAHVDLVVCSHDLVQPSAASCYRMDRSCNVALVSINLVYLDS